MGKTNRARVHRMFIKWLEGRRDCDVNFTISAIVRLREMVFELVSKAERRGRRKERKWWRENLPWFEAEPPFNAEKVRQLIRDLMATQYMLATTTPDTDAQMHRERHENRDSAFIDLLHELGIDDD